MTTRIFVTVGTDHHPLTRLIEWVDHWSASHDDLELVVQHGTARPSRHGVNDELSGGEEIAAQYAAADLVVSQVGPGTIADANRACRRSWCRATRTWERWSMTIRWPSVTSWPPEDAA